MNIGDRYNPRGFFKGIFIPNFIMECKDLSPIDKLVWGMLNKHAGTDGVCYPKQSTLAEEINCSIPSIIKALQTLEELEFISMEKATGKDKLLHLNNKYHFIWNDIAKQSCGSKNPLHGGVNILYTQIKEEIIKEEINQDLKPPSPLKSIVNRPSRSKQQIFPSMRPTRPTVPFLNMFPSNYQSNLDFQSIWKEYVEYRIEIKKPKEVGLTERAVKLMVTQIEKELIDRIDIAINDFVWCMKNEKIAPSLTYAEWKDRKGGNKSIPTNTPISNDPPQKVYRENTNNRICNPNGGY